MRIGENYSLEYTVELTGPVNNEAAVEVDPIATAPFRISDWDGYIAIRAIGGQVNYNVVRVIGGVEVTYTSGTLNDGETGFIVLDHSHVYRVYIDIATEGVKAVIGTRINYYACYQYKR